jgi:hypothetical protein
LRERRYGVALVFGEGMDFGTLLEALPLGERLVVLADEANARRVRAHWAFGVGVEVVEEGDASARRRWCACAQMVIFALKGEISLSVVVELVGCLAMGKLVIVTEHPEAEAYVVHRSNAWVVRAGDAGGLRAAMERFFREGHALAPMREAARRKVREEMGAGGFGRRLGEVLEEIRAERARKRGRVWGKSGGLEDHECVS